MVQFKAVPASQTSLPSCAHSWARSDAWPAPLILRGPPPSPQDGRGFAVLSPTPQTSSKIRELWLAARPGHWPPRRAGSDTNHTTLATPSGFLTGPRCREGDSHVPVAGPAEVGAPDSPGPGLCPQRGGWRTQRGRVLWPRQERHLRVTDGPRGPEGRPARGQSWWGFPPHGRGPAQGRREGPSTWAAAPALGTQTGRRSSACWGSADRQGSPAGGAGTRRPGRRMWPEAAV